MKKLLPGAGMPVPGAVNTLSQRSAFQPEASQGSTSRKMADILALIDEKRQEQGGKLKALREIQTKREGLMQELRKLDQEQADILTSFDA